MNPTVEPAATVTVSEAAPGETLQVMSAEVTSVTGELFCEDRSVAVEFLNRGTLRTMGWRTAAWLSASPAMSVFQISASVLVSVILIQGEGNTHTVRGDALRQGGSGDESCGLHVWH